MSGPYSGERFLPTTRSCGTCSRGNNAAAAIEARGETYRTVHHLCAECMTKRYGEGWAEHIKGEPQTEMRL